MATYAIGDIQGCFDSFLELLGQISFDPEVDRLLLTGDLVNRGPQSLLVLRWVRAHERVCQTVLGNHDLHLLACAEGIDPLQPGDTIYDVLAAPDADTLLAWLCRQPFVWREGPWFLVHAGLLPQWTIAQAELLATELADVLRGPQRRDFLASRRGAEPRAWSPDLRGPERWRLVCNAFTRLRFCTPAGQMEFKTTGGPKAAPPGYVPWFHVANAQWHGANIIFGHWAALGYYRDDGLIALDSGCVWGNRLTAVRLDDGAVFQVRCEGVGGMKPSTPEG